jgi:tol-pal system protein YbgF
MTTRILASLALGTALFISTGANAQLFNFGRNVDPATVQAMADRIHLLEQEVFTLSTQVADLSAQLQQMQEFLRTTGVSSTAPVASLTPPAAGPQIAAVPPPAPTTVRPTGSGVTTVIQLPPATVGGAGGIGAPASAVPGVGARSGLPEALPSTPGAPSAPLGPSTGGTFTTAAPPVKPPATAPVQTAALPPVPPLTPSGDAKADFDRSYNYITSGRYDVAETYFRTFLSAYPTSSLAGDAQYWLGQSLFQRAKYGDAAVVFRDGYKLYPKSERAPDTLLALGQSLAGMGQRDEACQIYAAALKQHPAMSATLKQRVITEQASAACVPAAG